MSSKDVTDRPLLNNHYFDSSQIKCRTTSYYRHIIYSLLIWKLLNGMIDVKEVTMSTKKQNMQKNVIHGLNDCFCF